MSKFIIYLLTLFASFSAFSQDAYLKLPQAKTQNPTYIFNKKIIGNEFLIKSLGSSEKEIKEKVGEISVLKKKPNRKNSDYYNLSSQGMVFVDLKEIIFSNRNLN